MTSISAAGNANPAARRTAFGLVSASLAGLCACLTERAPDPLADGNPLASGETLNFQHFAIRNEHLEALAHRARISY